MESSICLWIRNELILEFVIFAIVYFIGGFSEIIMINKIVASVVWRIDVDELDHAGVVLAQELQCVEVISFDVQVLGGIPVLAAFFDRSQGFGDGFAGQSVYGQINVYSVTTKSERYERSYWTRTAAGNGIGGRKAPVPYGS